ncbi:hypothetical protein BB561_000023 [Smittium simulii]|uniref:Uncharacterized protein n=1 Tax=Smittium simulii TaxID=133385 RepID=A0A2T9Z0Y4_9FUNG|nr:hypothetical protein BB561_002443 [Smittium simulii]PVU97782.1 hypothetical protein BB561_000333 [Smittium simulii]PVU98251.1 hypothetical protein BB561_000023 [Smittium simulii]
MKIFIPRKRNTTCANIITFKVDILKEIFKGVRLNGELSGTTDYKHKRRPLKGAIIRGRVVGSSSHKKDPSSNIKIYKDEVPN